MEGFPEKYQQINVDKHQQIKCGKKGGGGDLHFASSLNKLDLGKCHPCVNAGEMGIFTVPRNHRTDYVLMAKREIHISNGEISTLPNGSIAEGAGHRASQI